MNDVADLAKQVLDVRMARHNVYTSNVANAETEGYRAKVPKFSVVMDKAENAANRWKIEMDVKSSRSPVDASGNNVEMHKEISSMTENSLQYLSVIKIMSKAMGITRYAINSGTR